MTSREGAIEAAMADGIPIHKGYVAEVLDRAAEANQIHFADHCPRSKTRLRETKQAKRQADERCIDLAAERDDLRERLEALEEIRRWAADGWRAVADPLTDGSVRHKWRHPDHPMQEMSGELAAVLWPDPE